MYTMKIYPKLPIIISSATVYSTISEYKVTLRTMHASPSPNLNNSTWFLTKLQQGNMDRHKLPESNQ